jgi:hypothetical protein
MATIGKYGKVEFSVADIQFIKDNFHSMTNEAIATALGLKKTVVRLKAYELGLQRMKLEEWPKEAIQFLKENYHLKGNLEICKIFSLKFPKDKGWTNRHINKKMLQLGLSRSKLDLYTIKERNRDNGSFGNRNLKNNPPPPKQYFYLNPKTRIEIKPGQSIELLKQKYSNHDTRI